MKRKDKLPQLRCRPAFGIFSRTITGLAAKAGHLPVNPPSTQCVCSLVSVLRIQCEAPGCDLPLSSRGPRSASCLLMHVGNSSQCCRLDNVPHTLLGSPSPSLCHTQEILLSCFFRVGARSINSGSDRVQSQLHRASL